MCKKKALDRRSFLWGSSQIALSLPILDVMLNSHGTAFAAGEELPKRYIIMFNGVSIGREANAHYEPSMTGTGYDLPIGLESIGTNVSNNLGGKISAHNVQSDVSVISNLEIPSGVPRPDNGMDPGSFHQQAVHPQMTGQHAFLQGAPSSDVIAASLIGKIRSDGSRDPGLNLAIQASTYGTDRYSTKTTSFDNSGQERAPERSPKALYDRLIGPISDAAGSGGGSSSLNPELLRRRSILDFVRQDFSNLMNKLGSSDRIKISNHMDRIRDIELSIADLGEGGGMSTESCQVPTNPGSDPTIINPSSIGGYGQEHERGMTMMKLVHLAMACDIHRTANVMVTDESCWLNSQFLTGKNIPIHDLSHNVAGAGQTEMDKINAWNTNFFAYLVKLLKNTPEGAGSALDNTVVIMVNEGGHGSDSAEGGRNGPHSTDLMCSLLAGGKNFGLKNGIHIKTNKSHPTQVMITALKALGALPGGNERMGYTTGIINGLL